jgi:hypothetical protein
MRFASSELLKIETAFGSKTKRQSAESSTRWRLVCMQPFFALRATEGSSRHFAPKTGGGERDRTDDLLLAKQALSQLSYTPDFWWVWLDSNQRPPPYQDGALTG